jgi:hypothetical protein
VSEGGSRRGVQRRQEVRAEPPPWDGSGAEANRRRAGAVVVEAEEGVAEWGVGTEAQKFEMKKTARLFFVAPSKLRQFIVYAFLERHAVVLLTKLYRPRLCSKDQT